ncbi:MAG: hypothetical protein E7258_03400 [Lachnospiraceae bacterium]|nr:hypothetical protein [Lachnospiraceae bacterium]
MKRSRFIDLSHAFIICVVITVLFKLFYAADISKVKKLHDSKEDFLPVVAHIYSYRSDREKDSNGNYVDVYDIKYVYVVNETAYYLKLNNRHSLKETIDIYYNPSNPEENSFYASYEQAVKEFNVNKFIGDIFFLISFVLFPIVIYFYVFRKQYIVDDRKRISPEDIPLDKPYIVDEYGIWDSDDINNFIKDDESKFKVSHEGEKEVVDEIATISFDRKNSIVDNSEDNNV